MASKYRPGNVTGIDPVTKRFVSMTPAEFARELARKSERPPSRLGNTVDRACQNVVKMAKANVLRTAPIHNGNAYKYIDYDVEQDGPMFTGVIGYNRTYRPARLGNLLEFGGGGDHSPPHYDLLKAINAEVDSLTKKVGDDAEAYLDSRFAPEARPSNPGY